MAALWIVNAVGVDLFAGNIDPLDTDAWEFDVDPRCHENQCSPTGSSRHHLSLDALKLPHNAADVPPDAEVNRAGVTIRDDARRAISIVFCQRFLQIHRNRSRAKAGSGKQLVRCSLYQSRATPTAQIFDGSFSATTSMPVRHAAVRPLS